MFGGSNMYPTWKFQWLYLWQCTMGLSVALRIWNIWISRIHTIASFSSPTQQKFYSFPMIFYSFFVFAFLLLCKIIYGSFSKKSCFLYTYFLRDIEYNPHISLLLPHINNQLADLSSPIRSSLIRSSLPVSHNVLTFPNNIYRHTCNGFRSVKQLQ